MKKWNKKTIIEEARKFSSLKKFRKEAAGAYDAALNLNLMNEITQILPYKNKRWSKEELQKEALKYSTRQEFKQNSKAYSVAFNRGLLNKICAHMPKDLKLGAKPHNFKWNMDSLLEIASKYKSRSEFKRGSEGAYDAAKERKLLDTICAHMKKPNNTSLCEVELFNKIKYLYPNAVKIRERKITILGKPWIKGFDIDIFIPSLNKGVELDGEYWHSIEGMKRTKKDWPIEDIQNYRLIKDSYFLSKGIKILHLTDKEWLKDKEQSLIKVLEFLKND